jgi:hypothetical protein
VEERVDGRPYSDVRALNSSGNQVTLSLSTLEALRAALNKIVAGLNERPLVALGCLDSLSNGHTDM